MGVFEGGRVKPKPICLLSVGVLPRHMEGGKLCCQGALPIGKWAVGAPCNGVEPWLKLDMKFVNIAR